MAIMTTTVITIGLADDNAAFAALAPAAAALIADHADLFDVALRQHCYTVRERCSEGRGGEQRACADHQRDCELFHCCSPVDCVGQPTDSTGNGSSRGDISLV